MSLKKRVSNKPLHSTPFEHIKEKRNRVIRLCSTIARHLLRKNKSQVICPPIPKLIRLLNKRVILPGGGGWVSVSNKKLLMWSRKARTTEGKQSNNRLILPRTMPMFIWCCLSQRMTIPMRQDHKTPEIKGDSITGYPGNVGPLATRLLGHAHSR